MNEHHHERAEQAAATVIGILDQGTREIDAATLDGLYEARRRAVTGAQARHAGDGVLALSRHPMWLGMALAAALLAALWFGLRQPGTTTPAAGDTSELDILLLTGEVPPQVFADWGLVNQENVEDVCIADS
ncbi:MAG: DUF3619 family protein [Pseudomonadota bacterium]